ncbi:hypothetical protein GCM10009677_19580 [Sphaerisporangium rubeum]|uniref:Aspartyl/asparaginy/proline hydroxylase domain-containing protein n=1 Tax=Sphaerisporangium rubeum TaxID=321317 RepID=A0A7X0IMG6_9ACTN|nr:aspartyl/asparaginyl beta-hydroxylase domain-containing protein [Sphaerisporangium rubeum]MBB6476728.1 hypothetical protein [Sphaerisporangium rubeum]
MSTAQLSAVALGPRYDAHRLRAELDALGHRRFSPQRTFDRSGPAEETGSDWRVLSLRSQGGDPRRTDPGGPGLTGYADTPLLAEAPYMASILAGIPADLRTARLMALGPGASVDEHRDYPYGLPAGWVRLHVPVVTNPGAVLVIDGVEHRWQPGELWYGDFSRPHRVYNTGETRRVHLVIDCFVGSALLDMFPEEFRRRVRWSEVLFEKPELPLTPDEAAEMECSIGVPASFLDGDSLEAFTARWTLDRRAGLYAADGRLVLDVADGPSMTLVHIGEGEFRLLGWTTERTIKIDLSGRVPQARFRMRYGTGLAETVRAATPTQQRRQAS